MNKNKVSVLMTVYNTSKFLKKSIKSIINQTYKNFELIIIDDGSTDDSKKIIKNFRSKKIKKFFFKKNSGRIKAINFAIRKSSGNFIAILDSDDFSKKNRLKTQLDIFKKNKDLMLVGSLVDLVDEKNKKISTYPKIKDAQNFEQSIHLKNIFPFSSIVFKKKVLKKVSFNSKNIRQIG